MPRFVILEHDHPVLHWDLMLESGETLRTWRLAGRPDSAPVIAAEQLPDHRLMYLDYEGPVSGNRGTVRRWDTGDFEELPPSDGGYTIRLQGQILHGTVRLIQLNDSDWRFEQQTPC